MAEGHKFGGEWTQEKLTRLQLYLRAYMQAMKNQPFKLVYVDAFAGTGYVSPTSDEEELPLFEIFDAEEPKSFLQGSATIALEIDPPFHQYTFIDRKLEHVAELERLKGEYPDLASRIEIKQGDANIEVQRLCSNWVRTDRAVLFLDPYGMQVEWSTLLAIAKTRAIDLWLLFPSAIAVNRLLTKDGQISVGWKRRLDLLFGSDEWFQRFYVTRTEQDLFGSREITQRQATLDAIEGYFIEKLKSIFPKVAENPLSLSTPDGRPLYLLCFAASNDGRGGDLALRIAQHILSR